MECWKEEGCIEEERWEDKKSKNVDVIEGWRELEQMGERG